MPRWKPLVHLLLASLAVMCPLSVSAQGDDFLAAELIVRGRAVWSDFQVTGFGAGADVSATLRDDAGQPLAGVRVEVTLRPEGDAARAVHAVSASDGRVTARLESDAQGDARVTLDYPGSTLVEGHRAETSVRLGRVEPALFIELPPQIDADAPPPIVVRLQDARGAPIIDAAVTLSLDEATPAVERTNSEGVAGFSVARLAPGRHSLTARSLGDARHAEAVQIRTFEALRRASVQATVSRIPSETDPMSAPLIVDAEVTGPSSDALALRLRVDGQAVSLERPDARGRAVFEVPRRRLAPGTRTLEVEVTAHDPHWAVVRSSPMPVTLPPHAETLGGHVVWLALGLALGALMVAVIATRRAVPLVAPLPPAVQLTPRPDFEAAAAHATGAHGAGAILRITVVDAVSGHIVRAAVRWLEPSGEVTWTGDDGTAVLDGPGRVLEVSARGFVTARPLCAVDRATEATVRLMPLRAAIQRALERWLARWPAPQPRLGRETLLEIERHMRLAGYAEAMVTPLMRDVEAALFAEVAPDEATLAAVEAQLSTLVPRHT